MFKNNSKYFFGLLLTITIFSNNLCAKEKFPYLQGKILYQFEFDRVLSTKKKGVSPNNSFVYIEPDISLNINQNWAVKTQWRLQPNDVITTRDRTNPERYRTFLSNDRGMNFDEMGLLVEELKIHFQNDDIKLFAGKFDPTFGTAHRKTKRIGVFTSQFTEDYNLREKIGGGAIALLEKSQIQFNGFFNDNTSLSRSAINDRTRARRNDGLAGNTSTLSSYSVSMEGEDLFGVKNLFYNLGFRSLGVDKNQNRKRENGYVIGAEYLHKIGKESSVIPFAEFVNLSNMSGIKGRKAQYSTIAVIGNYRNWNSSLSFVSRAIDKNSFYDRYTFDRQFQLSVGYKFTNNITVDVSRAEIREQAKKGSLLGLMVSYLYKF
ncbi:MAG: hypothetical protein ACKO47_01460 [Alphaproteobacteria bacterium]